MYSIEREGHFEDVEESLIESVSESDISSSQMRRRSNQDCSIFSNSRDSYFKGIEFRGGGEERSAI